MVAGPHMQDSAETMGKGGGTDANSRLAETECTAREKSPQKRQTSRQSIYFSMA